MCRREIAHYLEHPPNCLHLNESFRPALFSKCDKRGKTHRKRVAFCPRLEKRAKGRLGCVLDDCDLLFFFSQDFFLHAFSRLLLQLWLRQQFATAEKKTIKPPEIYTRSCMTSGKKVHNQPRNTPAQTHCILKLSNNKHRSSEGPRNDTEPSRPRVPVQ